MTREWASHWQDTHHQTQEDQELAVKREGAGLVVDSDLPHLVCIRDNPRSTSVVLYHLQEGTTRIGLGSTECLQDITLTGPGIELEHCVFEYNGELVRLHPIAGSCFLNASRVTQPVEVNQGDVIMLGKSHLFRFNNPSQASRLRAEETAESTRRLSIFGPEEDEGDSGISESVGFSSLAELERQQREETDRLEEARRHLEELKLATKAIEAELLDKQQLIEQATSDGLWGACENSCDDQQSFLESNMPSMRRSSTPVLKNCSLLDESTCELMHGDDSMISADNFFGKQLSESAVQTSLDTSRSEEGTQANHIETQTSCEWHNLLEEKLQMERERMEEREAFASQLNDLNKKIACFEEEFMKQQEQIQHLEKERDRLVQLNEQLRLDEEMQKKDAERIQMKHLLAIDKQQLQHELEMAKLQRQLISERRRQIQAFGKFHSFSEAGGSSLVHEDMQYTVDTDSPQMSRCSSQLSIPQPKLILIGIPRAIVRTLGHDIYHVYEIRIKVEEQIWLVERRYREFAQFHSLLNHSYRALSTVDSYFPPTKWFGNRDPLFVEKRRRQLELYLKLALHCCSQVPECELSTLVNEPKSLTREAFCRVFPFFSTNSEQEIKEN
jgi:hypothetical protein